ncbi:hypothetical protein BBB44_01590 [Bordetella bronchiseptica]|nr:hypothetical protein BBB44_01590 [Bordetella bronchiseptica]AZW42288.1 tripartite tricarboxylate transporter substrate binding protein [Bordetella bronchiseptica]
MNGRHVPAVLGSHHFCKGNTNMRYNRRAFLGAMAALPAALGAARLAAASPAGEAGYPDRPIKFLVPFSAGSSTDIAARAYAEVTSRAIKGASVVVENRAGAGGNVGAAVIARSAPDGYSLLYSAATPYAIAPFVYPDLSYNPIRDFAPIAVTISVPVFVVVAGDSDIHTMADLAAHMKAGQQAVSYGSNGVGTSSHIICKLISMELGYPDVLHVPYRQGSQGVMADVIGKRLTYAVDPWSVVGPLVQSGRLRAIATTNGQRLSVAPDIPTLSEIFKKDFAVVTWNGLWAPSGTPQGIVDRLGKAFESARENQELVRQFESQGTPLMPAMSLAQTKTFMIGEVERWKRFVQASGIKL